MQPERNKIPHDSVGATFGTLLRRLTPSFPVGSVLGGRITLASVGEGVLIVSFDPRSVSAVNLRLYFPSSFSIP